MRTKSAQPSQDGNLAVAPDRQAYIRGLVTGIMACWNDANNPKKTIAQIQRSAGGLKEQAINLQPTDYELRFAKEQLKEDGVKVELAPIKMLLAFIMEAAEEAPELDGQVGDETHREVTEQFANLIKPEVATWTKGAITEEYELDEQVGNANQTCNECVGADALCVCNRPPAGMTSKTNIPRDPFTGRFIPRS